MALVNCPVCLSALLHGVIDIWCSDGLQWYVRLRVQVFVLFTISSNIQRGTPLR